MEFDHSVLSWSLEDIFNDDLYKDQVENIPASFQSTEQYFGSYRLPLLEETRAAMRSSMQMLDRAPYAEVTNTDEAKLHGTSLFDVKVDCWRNRYSDGGKESYKTLTGDVCIIADAKPETAYDLQRAGRTWTFALVTNISWDDDKDDISSTSFKVKALKEIVSKDEKQKPLFVVFLMNISTNRRIWNALHLNGNLKIIKEVLCNVGKIEESCSLCSSRTDGAWNESFPTSLLNQLNESQSRAVLACLNKMQCNHKSHVELIWGPPGTGKTKTSGVLLLTLLRMKRRALTCAPTDTAITEVAARVVKLVKEDKKIGSVADGRFCSLGDILLFGTEDRLNVNSETEEIFLDHRVERLTECFGPQGWLHCFNSMITFLEDCVSDYHIFSRKYGEGKGKSFLEYARERFTSTASPLRRCVLILTTHIPKINFREHDFQDLETLFGLLDSFESGLFLDSIVSEEVEQLFLPQHSEDGKLFSRNFTTTLLKLCAARSQCLSVLKTLRGSLGKLKLPPRAQNKDSIINFCFQTATLLFSTASGSYRLCEVTMKPLNVLVIDEAAQLKECESAIPLQLPGISHSILIGDELQLPATVLSNVSNEAGFGRSLFQRLKTFGKANHLLNIQYRMHPSISCFPNARFYQNQILDAPSVGDKSCKRHYLPWSKFGHYSFINVSGREEVEDVGHSCRNMVEVAVVQRLVRTLYKAWCGSREKLSVGIISHYAAQVAAIQEKLGQRYEKIEGFVVKVKSVDGFQGGEEDIIILSGAIGLVSNPQITNVALTRARHSLWILGNGRTLARSESEWKALVNDAKARNCFFNADEDEELAKAILEAKKEFDQLDELLNVDSDLFQNAKWKVLCSDNFRRSFRKLKSFQTQKLVLTLLLKLSKGWRPKRRKADFNCESSSMVLKKFKVEVLYIVCSMDVAKEQRQSYTQVLRAWDLLPLEEIEGLVKRLDGIFKTYTDDFISHCNEKYLEGDLEVPKTWKASSEMVKFKTLSQGISDNTSSEGAYVEKSKVSESLLLMKFYSLSSGLVNYFLSDRDGRQLELPFEVTDQELDVILFPRSCFILGRSGTGKTTVLTMKLFEKEQLHHLATVGLGEVNTKTSNEIYRASRIAGGVGGTEAAVFRQLFVTVSPLLCHAVKHHILQLKRFASGGNYSQESALQNVDDIDGLSEQLMDIPDSFIDILPKEYPLVITLQKFLIMLDGTIGKSFFEKFLNARELSNWEVGKAPIFLRNFIRTREVNYEKFCSSYWPHFNAKLAKELDSSRVFTEIMSHIKGGLRAGDSYDGRLDEEEYVNLSEGRFSTLSRHEREMIYDIFKSYEKMKGRNGEFDMADLVIDLHRRFKNERYEGDIMDFVYIDEVQDLTTRQIALFKYVCKNVSEGFVFCGDTAQTIAKGIDFRFEDIRSLFYTQFVLESQSKSEANDGKKGKGQISKCFQSSQNFRTHDGVLRLAQSVINLLYRFFPSFVDILCPETSLINGEAPIFLEPDRKGNAIATILELFNNVVSDMAGFGAEQVILVRDDIAKNEILKYFGKQALVLTIMECKGLEFQDILLYNFFGSSPLKSQWRVIYEYMMEQGLLDASWLFPSFKQEKHNILCSELKQLYVAITRTRQRLWICENEEEFSKPMFDYWKRMDLIQVRKLDGSLARSMQVTSSQEDWKSRGFKLLQLRNYAMAAICFERAHDSYWEKLAKALGLRADADRVHSSNPDRASCAWRQAAEIFYSIGKAEETADCFYMSKDYEKAGQIYLERCEESALKRAAECFILAGRFETAGQIYLEKFGESSLEKAAKCFVRAGSYKTAAEVYARGNYVSECLSVCKKGKLFDTGLRYIEHWKQHENADEKMVERSEDMDELKQTFLESIACYYHKINDKRTMMNYVRGFDSMTSIRTFLLSIKCFDELLCLEEELGYFLEAANIAKLTGEIELGADLLGKGSYFEEAATLILWFVFANTLWCARSTGWQLEQFTEKEKLLTKAKSFAMKSSNQFYGLVCLEVLKLAGTMVEEQQGSHFSVKTNLLQFNEPFGRLEGTLLEP